MAENFFDRVGPAFTRGVHGLRASIARTGEELGFDEAERIRRESEAVLSRPDLQPRVRDLRSAVEGPTPIADVAELMTLGGVEALPSFGLMAGGAVTGRILGGARGAMAGAVAPSAVAQTGENLSEAEARGGTPNLPVAAGYGLVGGLADVLAPWHVVKSIPKVIGAGSRKGILRTGVERGIAAGSEEAITEGFQRGLTEEAVEAQGGKKLTGDDYWWALGDAAVRGFGGGATIGAPTGMAAAAATPERYIPTFDKNPFAVDLHAKNILADLELDVRRMDTAAESGRLITDEFDTEGFRSFRGDRDVLLEQVIRSDPIAGGYLQLAKRGKLPGVMSAQDAKRVADALDRNFGAVRESELLDTIAKYPEHEKFWTEAVGKAEADAAIAKAKYESSLDETVDKPNYDRAIETLNTRVQALEQMQNSYKELQDEVAKLREIRSHFDEAFSKVTIKEVYEEAITNTQLEEKLKQALLEAEEQQEPSDFFEAWARQQEALEEQARTDVDVEEEFDFGEINIPPNPYVPDLEQPIARSARQFAGEHVYEARADVNRLARELLGVPTGQREVPPNLQGKYEQLLGLVREARGVNTESDQQRIFDEIASITGGRVPSDQMTLEADVARLMKETPSRLVEPVSYRKIVEQGLKHGPVTTLDPDTLEPVETDTVYGESMEDAANRLHAQRIRGLLARRRELQENLDKEPARAQRANRAPNTEKIQAQIDRLEDDIVRENESYHESTPEDYLDRFAMIGKGRIQPALGGGKEADMEAQGRKVKAFDEKSLQQMMTPAELRRVTKMVENMVKATDLDEGKFKRDEFRALMKSAFERKLEGKNNLSVLNRGILKQAFPRKGSSGGGRPGLYLPSNMGNTLRGTSNLGSTREILVYPKGYDPTDERSRQVPYVLDAIGLTSLGFQLMGADDFRGGTRADTFQADTGSFASRNRIGMAFAIGLGAAVSDPALEGMAPQITMKDMKNLVIHRTKDRGGNVARDVFLDEIAITENVTNLAGTRNRAAYKDTAARIARSNKDADRVAAAHLSYERTLLREALKNLDAFENGEKPYIVNKSNKNINWVLGSTPDKAWIARQRKNTQNRLDTVETQFRYLTENVLKFKEVFFTTPSGTGPKSRGQKQKPNPLSTTAGNRSIAYQELIDNFNAQPRSVGTFKAEYKANGMSAKIVNDLTRSTGLVWAMERAAKRRIDDLREQDAKAKSEAEREVIQADVAAIEFHLKRVKDGIAAMAAAGKDLSGFDEEAMISYVDSHVWMMNLWAENWVYDERSREESKQLGQIAKEQDTGPMGEHEIDHGLPVSETETRVTENVEKDYTAKVIDTKEDQNFAIERVAVEYEGSRVQISSLSVSNQRSLETLENTVLSTFTEEELKEYNAMDPEDRVEYFNNRLNEYSETKLKPLQEKQKRLEDVVPGKSARNISTAPTSIGNPKDPDETPVGLTHPLAKQFRPKPIPPEDPAPEYTGPYDKFTLEEAERRALIRSRLITGRDKYERWLKQKDEMLRMAGELFIAPTALLRQVVRNASDEKRIDIAQAIAYVDSIGDARAEKLLRDVGKELEFELKAIRYDTAAESFQLGRDIVDSQRLSEYRAEAARLVKAMTDADLKEVSAWVGARSKELGIKSKLYVLNAKDAFDELASRKMFDRAQRLVTGNMHALTLSDYKGGIGIFIHPSIKDSVLRQEMLAHEMGHVVFRDRLAHATEQEAQAILQQFHRWRDSFRGASARVAHVVHSKKPWRSALAAIGKDLSTRVSDLDAKRQEYLFDFEEWFADEAGKAILRTAPARTLVQKWFHKLVAAIRKLLNWTPNSSVSQFINALQTGTAKLNVNSNLNILDRLGIYHTATASEQINFESDTFQNMAQRFEEMTGQNLKKILKMDFDSGKIKDVWGHVWESLHTAKQRGEHGVKARLAWMAAANEFDPHGAVNHLALRYGLARMFNSDEYRSLARAAASAPVKRQMLKVLGESPRVVKELGNPEVATAYMYQLWAAGAITVGEATDTKLKQARETLNDMWGVISDDKRAEQIMTAMRDGVLHLRQVSDNPTQRLFEKTLKEKAEEKLGPSMTRFTKGMAKVFLPADSRMRRSGIPAFEWMADRFHSRTGNDFRGETYPERKAKMIGRFSNLATQVFEGKDSAFGQETVAVLNAPHLYKNASPDVKQAVDDVHALMRHIREYVRNVQKQRKGFDMGDLSDEGYFPWVFDVEYLEGHKDEFISFLKKDKYHQELKRVAVEYMHTEGKSALAYAKTRTEKNALNSILASLENLMSMENPTYDVSPLLQKHIEEAGLSFLTAETVPELIYQHIVDELGVADTEINPSKIGHVPKVQYGNKRVLKFVTDLGTEAEREEWAQFLSKELGKTMRHYIESMVKRVEYVRMFGAKGEELEQRFLEAERAMLDRSPEDRRDTLEQARRYVNAMLGTSGYETNEWLSKKIGWYPKPGRRGEPINPTLQKTMSGIMVYQNVRLLNLATLTSLVDPLGIAVRTGDFKMTWEAFKTGIASAIANVKGKQSELYYLADTMGIIDSHLTNEALGWQYGGTYMSGLPKKINETFFKWIGLTGWTKMTRVMALAAGRRFIQKHGFHPNEMSERFMSELGVTKDDLEIDDHGELMVWDRAKWATMRKLALEGDKDARKKIISQEKVRNALYRFVDEAILRPTAAQRPVWASDPHFMLIFHLKSFMYSFHDRIIRRAVHEAKEGHWTPVMALGAFVPSMIASDMIRDVVQHGGTPPHKAGWDFTDYVASGMTRSGVLGIGNIATDAASDVEHGGWGFESLAGPTVQQAINFDFEKALPGQNLYRGWLN